MKSITRIVVIMLLALLAISVSLVAAQTETVSDEIAGIATQVSLNGNLVDNGDDTYTLTLEEVGSFASWALSSPSFRSVLYPTEQFALDWSSAPELSVEAVLQFQSSADVTLLEDAFEATLNMVISSPAFDPETNTLTYIATIDMNSIEGIAAVKGEITLPETLSFENAGLFVIMNDGFLESLVQGRQDRFNVRGFSVNSCWPVGC